MGFAFLPLGSFSFLFVHVKNRLFWATVGQLGLQFLGNPDARLSRRGYFKPRDCLATRSRQAQAVPAGNASLLENGPAGATSGPGAIIGSAG
jgi:hypothetical protein